MNFRSAKIVAIYIGLSALALTAWYYFVSGAATGRLGMIGPAEFLSLAQTKAIITLLALPVAVWATCRVIWRMVGLRQRSVGKVQDHEA